jgi:hypothetical protein
MELEEVAEVVMGVEDMEVAEVREGGKRAGSWEAERVEAMEAVVRAVAPKEEVEG